MFDRENILIVLPYFCLLFIGLVMVASSSVYVSEDLYGTPFHFASRQVIFLLLGIFATIIALSIPSNLFFSLDWLILIGSLLLLIALFFRGGNRGKWKFKMDQNRTNQYPALRSKQACISCIYFGILRKKIERN